MNEIDKKVLQGIVNTREGRVLREYLESKMREVESVRDCKTESELIGKKEALKVLDDIFSFLKPQKEAKQKKPNNYV